MELVFKYTFCYTITFSLLGQKNKVVPVRSIKACWGIRVIGVLM